MMDSVITFFSFSILNVSVCFLSFLKIRNKWKIALFSLCVYISMVIYNRSCGHLTLRHYFIFLGVITVIFLFLRVILFLIPFWIRFLSQVMSGKMLEKIADYIMIAIAFIYTLLSEYMVGDWIFNPDIFKEIWG